MKSRTFAAAEEEIASTSMESEWDDVCANRRNQVRRHTVDGGKKARLWDRDGTPMQDVYDASKGVRLQE